MLRVTKLTDYATVVADHCLPRGRASAERARLAGRPGLKRRPWPRCSSRWPRPGCRRVPAAPTAVTAWPAAADINLVEIVEAMETRWR